LASHGVSHQIASAAIVENIFMPDVPNILQERQSRRAKMRFGPSGIHLFDRISGMNVLIEEIVPAQSTWARAPRQISIALTNNCDLACPFCFAPKSHATLPPDRVASWLDELDTNGTFGVGFGGGEPTQHRKFIDLCAYATRRTRLAVTFTTHGHRLDDKALAELKGNVHFVRVSVDGLETTYERIRQRPFAVLRQRLSAIKELCPFGMNYVVNCQTLPDLDAAAIFAEEVGASELLILPERPANGKGGITAETLRALQIWVRRYKGGVRLAVSESAAEGMPICNPLPNEVGLKAYAHVDANGVIKRSSFDRQGISIGSDGIMAALRRLENQTNI
jgi:MoaA/NifB/PqqE/SkfB family radical SAM enzyme